MKHLDQKTELQKIEKLLERTLNAHFEKISKGLGNSNRLSIADAKYQPPKSPSPNNSRSPSPHMGYRLAPTVPKTKKVPPNMPGTKPS